MVVISCFRLMLSFWFLFLMMLVFLGFRLRFLIKGLWLVWLLGGLLGGVVLGLLKVLLVIVFSNVWVFVVWCFCVEICFFRFWCCRLVRFVCWIVVGMLVRFCWKVWLGLVGFM